MEVYSTGSDLRSIDRHGSIGASVEHIARPISRAQLVVIELEPGGVLGRHDAQADQLFIVVAGSGSVSGGDGVEVEIGAGMAAFWTAAESHETRAGEEGLRAIVLEGEFGRPGRG